MNSSPLKASRKDIWNYLNSSDSNPIENTKNDDMEIKLSLKMKQSGGGLLNSVTQRFTNKNTEGGEQTSKPPEDP